MSHPAWEKTKGYSKRGFDKAYNTLDKLQKPVNRLSNKLGSEAFWPTTLDKESDKAARILRSFCKDGFYSDVSNEEIEGQLKKGKSREDLNMPRGKQRVVKKIPETVIRNAIGLAIFTTMRSGLWLSGSGGSGVLVARNKETGEWSPPSGIHTQTMGVGFLAGVDIYDCVVVINTYEALEGFKTVRCTLGGEASAVAGPVGVGGLLDSEVHKRRTPIWTYIKSRGFYAGVEIMGTAIIERADENERFYGERIPVADILAGKVKRPPSSISSLMQTIKAAQGDSDVAEGMLPDPGQAPGDMDLGSEEKPFGIPDIEDPDPYGVRALEREGVMIREAGTRRMPNIEIFDFRPSPTSPVYSSRSRWSTDSGFQSPSWRSSAMSSQSSTSVDRGTQTDAAELGLEDSSSCRSRISPRRSRRNTSSFRDSIIGHESDESVSESEPRITHPLKQGTQPCADSQITLTAADQTVRPRHQRRASAVSTTPASFTRAKLVTIPKRKPQPPALPPRNPDRLISPVTSSSEAGKTSLLSPSSGYDDDVKSVEINTSLLRADTLSGYTTESLSRHLSALEKEENDDEGFYSPREQLPGSEEKGKGKERSSEDAALE